MQKNASKGPKVLHAKKGVIRKNRTGGGVNVRRQVKTTPAMLCWLLPRAARRNLCSMSPRADAIIGKMLLAVESGSKSKLKVLAAHLANNDDVIDEVMHHAEVSKPPTQKQVVYAMLLGARAQETPSDEALSSYGKISDYIDRMKINMAGDMAAKDFQSPHDLLRSRAKDKSLVDGDDAVENGDLDDLNYWALRECTLELRTRLKAYREA